MFASVITRRDLETEGCPESNELEIGVIIGQDADAVYAAALARVAELESGTDDGSHWGRATHLTSYHASLIIPVTQI